MRFAVAICLSATGLLLSPVATHAQTQLDILHDIVSACIQTDMKTDGWQDALSGWSVQDTATSEQLYTFNAQQHLHSAPFDETTGIPLARTELLEAYRIGFDTSLPYAKMALREDTTHILSHPLGWTAVITQDADRKSLSCQVWHDSPDTEVLDYMTFRYMGLSMYDHAFGTISRVQIYEGGSFFAREVIDISAAQTKTREIKAAPDLADHPARYLPAAQLSIFRR